MKLLFHISKPRNDLITSLRAENGKINKQTKLKKSKIFSLFYCIFVKVMRLTLCNFRYSVSAGKAAVRMWQLAPMKLNKIKTKALDSPILIGRVLPGRTPYEEASGFRPGDLGLKERDKEVRIPYFVYDDYFKAFFEHEWDFAVKDEEKVQGYAELNEYFP